MKTKTFKTKTNSGHIVHIKVRILDAYKEMEPAILIDTIRIVPIKDIGMYCNINSSFPTFQIIRKTKNYVVFVSRTSSFKISTFRQINKLVDEMS